MNYGLVFLLAAFSLSAITILAHAARRRRYQLFLLLAALGMSAHAQNWSGIIDPSRAINWTTAGVVGGIPDSSWAQCGSTIAAGATAATIQTAINNCSANHFVLLGAGTFNLSTGLTLKSNVVLRGQGANQTILNFSGAAGCFYGGATICISSDLTTWSNSTNSNTGRPGGTNAANWTAGYGQGATSITVANVGSVGIANGQYIYLDQANDTSVGSGLFNCDLTSPACSIEGGSPGQTIGGVDYSQLQVVQVAAGCSKACTGAGPFTLTISPGLYGTNWTSSKTPTAWWPLSMVQYAGVENMSLNLASSGLSDNGSAVNMFNAANSWVSGVAILHGSRAGVWMIQAAHNTLQNSYFYQTIDNASQSYGVEEDQTSDNLVVNNIMQQVTAPLMGGAQFGNSFAYNYAINDYQTASANCMYPVSLAHDAGAEYNLWEGNFFENVEGDDVHGSNGLNTVFRNVFTGYELGKSCATIAVTFDPYNRYENVVGNVLGTPGHTTYYDDFYSPNPSDGNTAPQYVYVIDEVHGGVGPDSFVGASMLRWANYDNVTGAVRFCGNSSDTGWSTVCKLKGTSTSEVPTGLPSYANAVPSYGDTGAGQSAMPASFIYSSKPSWWPSAKPWPPVGPDVTNGNVGQCTTGTYQYLMGTASSQCSGGSFSASVNAGHANSNPAMDCYFSLSGPPDGSGSALGFNANTCYGSTGTSGTQPPPPTGISGTAVVKQ
jgi:hypothetical protein